MKDSEITDIIFREAVEAIDADNIIKLEQLLKDNPKLIQQRLDAPTKGYLHIHTCYGLLLIILFVMKNCLQILLK